MVLRKKSIADLLLDAGLRLELGVGCKVFAQDLKGSPEDEGAEKEEERYLGYGFNKLTVVLGPTRKTIETYYLPSLSASIGELHDVYIQNHHRPFPELLEIVREFFLHHSKGERIEFRVVNSFDISPEED